MMMSDGNQLPPNTESGVDIKKATECIKNTRDSYLSAGGSLEDIVL